MSRPSKNYLIDVRNAQNLLSIDSRNIENVVRTVLQAEQVLRAEIDISIVDDPQIHVVNRDHLEHDYPTDVISFLYDSLESPETPPAGSPRGWRREISGELIVSAETALREAKNFHWPAEHELALYLVHGLLHLCSYDDLTEEEQPIMRSRERAILQLLGMTPNYTEN